MCKVQEQPNISFVKLSSLASLLAMATDVMIYSIVGRQMGIKNSKCISIQLQSFVSSS